jgi:glycogen synthase
LNAPKTLMLGWEFPPFISGGLGTACYGLTKAMSRRGMKITFILPKADNTDYSSHVKMLSAEGYVKSEGSEELSEFKNVHFKTISSPLKPYASSSRMGKYEIFGKTIETNSINSWQCESSGSGQNYGRDIYEQVHRYAQKVVEIASVENFNIIHAHDWMTFPAAIAVAQISKNPLVVHVHSTEFDRSGENVNQTVYDIERHGMHAADKVITVSNYTKNMLISRYGVPSDKVEVVYNAVEHDGKNYSQALNNKLDKTVLFLGRITMQKGPEYFIAAAKKVLEKISNVKFIMAGDGDMTHRMIEYAAHLGIGHKVFFTRFLRGADVDKAYEMADLYVMPSVSEPFGIAPLEALRHDVPVLISKQSGVAEILSHALKVDFWDINQMANKIAAVLKYQPLRGMLRENGRTEAGRLRWEDSAAQINNIYKQMLACA